MDPTYRCGSRPKRAASCLGLDRGAGDMPLVWFHVPLRIAFMFARPELDRIASQVAATGTPMVTPVRAGTYMIASCRRYGGDDAILLQIFNLGCSGGFSHCPTQGPVGYYNTGADGHLAGHWYWWIDDCATCDQQVD